MQLTVRSNAQQTISVFLSLTDFTESQKCFLSVIGKLGPLDSQKPTMLIAYQSEGLLSVLDTLVKDLPFHYVLANWSRFYPTIHLYLSHSASTVRQVVEIEI